MFDGELVEGGYDTGTGTPSDVNYIYRNKNMIKVNPNTQYTLSIDGVSQKYCLYFYREDKSFISSNISLTSGTFTTPTNTAYVNFRCFAIDYVSNFTSLKVQMELGDTATAYEYTTQKQLLSLGSMELCCDKTGNYRDCLFKAIEGDKFYDGLTEEQKATLTIGKWYKYKIIKKGIFDGTES